MKIILFLYIIFSLLFGAICVYKQKQQNKYLDTFPIGDIGYYVVPKKNITFWNIMFFPSLIIISIWRLWGK